MENETGCQKSAASQDSLDWEKIEANIKDMGLVLDRVAPEGTFAGFVRECGYEAHAGMVDLRHTETVNADLGVIVTNLDRGTNNGVYIFCVMKDHTLGLVTVIPSTVSKTPMVRRVSGDVTSAVTGLVLPPLTPFDMVEVTGQVIANTVMKDIMSAYHIPEGKQKQFISIYMPKFLANVAKYYLGAADAEGNPMVNEEIVDMEPFMVRQMVIGEKQPDGFGDGPSSAPAEKPAGEPDKSGEGGT